MNEYIQAIYEIAVSNNKFLIATEQRLINIEAKLDVLLGVGTPDSVKEMKSRVPGDNKIWSYMCLKYSYE